LISRIELLEFPETDASETALNDEVENRQLLMTIAETVRGAEDEPANALPEPPNEAPMRHKHKIRQGPCSLINTWVS
jgi:hypothetical protein